MTRGALLLSDVHLSDRGGQAASRALAELLSNHREAELILVGDILDLTLFPVGLSAAQSAPAALSGHPELIASLRRHLGSGGRVTWIPGNHDAGVEDPDAVASLRKLLACPDERQLTICPWFLRRGAVHIEHGHLYDRDCAPNHPLADQDGMSEGLGTALMRRFVAPHDALVFAHAHSTTPLSGLQTALRHWGFRAPLVIADYFRTALAICAETQLCRARFQRDAEEGELRLSAHAHSAGLSPEALRALLSGVAPPTHHVLRDTFFRLYFDRITASLALGAGVSLLGWKGLGLAAATPQLGAGAMLLGSLGAGYLLQSYFGSTGPAANEPVSSLSAAARLVSETTAAETVIFGHTHVEVSEPGYTNLGSFGFAAGERPYTLLSEDGRLERCSLAR